MALAISSSKLTGRMFKAAISQYLAHRKNGKSKDTVPHGKQTVKQLIGQNQGVSNIELTDPGIRDFDRVARKYGVDYAIKRDRSNDPPRFLIFFKSRDADALTAAFQEYTARKVKKAERPSVLEKLEQFKDMVKNTAEKVRKKVLER